jgi:hypothetical protein
LSPITTNRQNPALGNSKVRSAITNPTFKNKFDAGRNGSTIKLIAIILVSLKTSLYNMINEKRDEAAIENKISENV